MSRLFTLLFIGLVSAQGPGNGVAKTTMSSSQPLLGLEFMLKYLPTTVAEDSCYSNYCKAGSFPDGEKWQGRAQLVEPFTGLAKRSCTLYSAVNGYVQNSGATNIVASSSQGSDCGYYPGYAFDATKATLMHTTFAHNQDTCCKACAATTGCTAATFTSTSARGRRLLQPQYGEGFGLHLVNVVSSLTTGGLDVATLESKMAARIGNLSSMDAFMEYNVLLFTANLPAYQKLFSNDNIPTFAAQWALDGQPNTMWYSLFVHVPGSQLVLELVGSENPAGNAQLPTLETRLSSRNVQKFSQYYKDDNNLVYAAAVGRATSDMTTIDWFYTTVLKASVVLSSQSDGVTRKCYAWTGAASDVCFTARASGAQGDFTVKNFEDMLWSVHASVLTTPGANPGDKYNDNHYAVDLQTSGDFIAEYFIANNTYPITTTTKYAWACSQHYIIDPTGWSIQTDLFFTKSYPGCSSNTEVLPM